ncbi:MAG: 4-(cytidine 5'-diphospho)-2-C-methyl-D-erythritol kinase [Armatimonadota bacterium]
MPANGIIVHCRAKINLTLDILDKRPDGYHNLKSVMQSVDVVDTLRIEKNTAGSIKITASLPDLPTGPGNTVYSASELFFSAAEINSGITIFIEKRIPHQAGMGGGSSDAAGALLGLNKLFGSPLSLAELTDLAAQIGSDVPYFLYGGTAVISGRGEIVEKLPDAPKLDLVVVKPDVGVPTAWAYKQLAETDRLRSSASTDFMIDAIKRGDRAAVIGNISNDFDDIVAMEFSEIAEIKNRLLSLGAERAMLSGSGAAVFGVFDSSDEAAEAVEMLKTDYPFVVATAATAEAVCMEM